MPYWSTAEWRARIGSSWCALGRPHKIKPYIKHGKKIRKKELSFNLVVTVIIIFWTIPVGMNIFMDALVTERHHHRLLGKCLVWQFDCILHPVSTFYVPPGLFNQMLCIILLHKICILKLALVLTLILKTLVNLSLKHYQWQQINYYSCVFSFGFCFMMFLLIKIIYPVMDLSYMLVHAGTYYLLHQYAI